MKTVSATAFTGVYTGVTLYASDKSGVCFLFALTKLKQLVSLLSCCKTLRHLSDVPGNASHVTRHRLTNQSISHDSASKMTTSAGISRVFEKLVIVR